jgi:allantoin racemase
MAQRIAVIGTGFTPTGGTAPPQQIRAVAGQGFEPILVETRYSAFPSNPYDRGLAAVGYVDAGVTAGRDGAAGIFINTFGDYGLAELKSALGIPVVGAGEAAMALAATLGRRFAIVTIWPTSLRFIFDERLAACGMQDRCVDVVSVLDQTEMGRRGDAEDPVLAMRAGKAAVVDRIITAAEGIIARGADTVVLGCTCMAPVAGDLAARLPVPVVDPMTAGYKFTETLVALKLSQSAIAYPRPGEDRLSAIGALVTGAPLEASASSDCEVCVVADAAE